MSDWLDKDIILLIREKIDDLPEHGEVVHINHDGCPAGVDTKKRLYVTVSDDERAVLAFCHNCQCKGYWPNKTSVRKRFATATDGIAKSKDRVSLVTKWLWDETLGAYERATPVAPFATSNSFIDDAFPEGSRRRDLFYSKYLGFGIVEDLDDPNTDIIIPYFNSDGVLTGLDIRQSGDLKPKWKRISPVDSDNRSYNNDVVVYNPENSDIGVIVEDPLSAMVVACHGYAGICIHGVHIKEADYLRIRARFDKLIVWLDNDNTTVRDQRDKILKKFSALGCDITCVKTAKEPKKKSDEDVEWHLKMRAELISQTEDEDERK